jgi:hypothetical protein
MKTLNDILSKLKFDRESNPMEAHQQVLDLFAVSGWLEIEGNESVFNEYAKFNCWCRFDDGTECRYEDEHPMAIMTHFRCK